MLKIAHVFQSGMILQRQMPVHIWGCASPGEKIIVQIQGKHGQVRADESGQWQIILPALEKSFQETMTISGEMEQQELRDIGIGEVFIAGGQSNMEFWMRYEKHYSEALATCEDSWVRFYDVPKLSYDGKEKDFDYHNVGIWRKATKKDLEYFSAVGYYFEKKLHEDLDVPVGIIGCTWGGTRSLTWMREDHARKIQKEQTRDFFNRLKGRTYEQICAAAGEDPSNDTGNSTWSAFNDFILPSTPSAQEIQDFLGAEEENRALTEQPHLQDAPGTLYRHMVQKLAPYTVRGVLWYQGESDDAINGTQKNYKAALTAIMQDWREAWDNKELPFLVVQLPGFYSWFGCVDQGFPMIRQCQKEAVDEDSYAWLCSISDAGERMDIHPKDKKTPGERLALLAERHIYGRNILADAPCLQMACLEGDRIRLRFENAGSGLSVRGSRICALQVTADGQKLDFSEMILGDMVILSLSGGPFEKVRVEFACEPWYQVNLYNSAGIPAIPFCILCSENT